MRGSILVLLALVLMLAGCGQKGPLYREGGEAAPENARAPAASAALRHLC